MENAELNMKTEPMQAAGHPSVKSTGSVNCLAVGTRLSEFELTGVIGEGGFGAVYLAFDHSLQRTVAIKEYMPTALAERNDDKSIVVRSQRHQETFDAGLRSFINEARLLAQFDHPALIKVHRFLEQNNTAYMAMRYYQGRTLKQILKSEPELITENWLKSVISPLLDALAELYKINILHRDISPDNIMIQDNGAAVLLDFGAARQIISDMTQMLTVILKPGYAPVEQYADDASMKQGPWTDIYALSAVIYTAITKKPPPTSVARMIKDPIKLLDVETYPDYSAAFLDAINKGMAVNPDHRPQTIEQFREMLGLEADATRYLDQRTIQPTMQPARPQPVTQPTPPVVPPASPVVQQTTPAPAQAPAPVKFEDDSATILIKNPGARPPAQDPNLTQKFVPPTPPAQVPAPVAAAPVPAPAPAVATQKAVPAKKSGSNKQGLLIAVGAVVVIGAIVTVAVLFNNGAFDAPKDTPPAAAASAPPVVAEAPAATTPATPPADPAADAAAAEEAKDWDGLKDALPTAPDTAANLNAFIAKYPNGKFIDAARAKLASLPQTAGTANGANAAAGAAPGVPGAPGTAPGTSAAGAATGAAASAAASAASDPAKVTGNVAFAISPWGNVFIDDAPKGPSPPLKRIALPEGKHHIRIVNGSFPEYALDVDVKKNATSSVQYDFTQHQ